MLQADCGIIRVAEGCRVVRLKPINFEDPWIRWQSQQFARTYQEAVRARRDPGKDPEVLRLLQLVVEGNGQPRLPGFED